MKIFRQFGLTVSVVKLCTNAALIEVANAPEPIRRGGGCRLRLKNAMMLDHTNCRQNASAGLANFV